MSWIRNSGGHPLIGAPPPPPGGGLSSNLQPVINLSQATFYGGFFPYLNLVKNTDQPWTSNPSTGGLPPSDLTGDQVKVTASVVNSNYELSNLSSGQTCTLLVFLGIDVMFGYDDHPIIKDGTYVLKWDGAGNLTPSYGSVLTGPGRRTFTMNQASATSLYLTATNGPVTNIRCCHLSHESALDSGEILDPDFVTWLQTWPTAKAFRFLDIEAHNFSLITTASQITPMSHISWSRANYGCPPEILAEVAKKTGRNIWPLTHARLDDAGMVSWYQRIKNWYDDGSYLLLVEGVNEAWNGGFYGTKHLANDPSGPDNYPGYNTFYSNVMKNEAGTTIGSPNAQERHNSNYAHHLLRCIQAADSVFGSSRVIPMAGVQTGFPAYFRGFFNYSDPGVMSGQTVKQILNARNGAICYTLYWSCTSGNQNSDPTNPTDGNFSSRKVCYQDWGGTKPESEIVDLWEANRAYENTNYLAVGQAWFNGQGFTGRYMAYEGGCHDFVDRHLRSDNEGTGWYYKWASFSATTDTGDNTLNFGTFVAGQDHATQTMTQNGNGWLSDFDVIGINSTAPGGTSLATWPANAWIRKVGTNKVRLYPSLAAAQGDTGNTGVGASSIASGSYNSFFNKTRHEALCCKLRNILNGTSAATFVQNTIVPDAQTYNIENIPIFAAPAIMRGGNGSGGTTTAQPGDFTAGYSGQRFTYSFDAMNRGFRAGSESPVIAYLKTLNIP